MKYNRLNALLFSCLGVNAISHVISFSLSRKKEIHVKIKLARKTLIRVFKKDISKFSGVFLLYPYLRSSLITGKECVIITSSFRISDYLLNPSG